MYGDHLNLVITTGNANRKGILSQTIINTFKKCKGRRKGIETQSEMMVAPKWLWFYNYRNKLFSGGLFCDLNLSISYLFLEYCIKFFGCAIYLVFRHSNKSGYGFPKIIHHILVGAHQVKLFSNKIFYLHLV